MNINIATEISDTSFHFTRTSVFSFIETNKWFNGTIYLISHQSLPVSDRNIKIIQSIYPKVEVLDVTGDPVFAKYLNVSSRQNTSAELYLDLRFALFNLKLLNILFFSSSSIFFSAVTDILSANTFTASRDLNLFYLARPLTISKFLASGELKKYILDQAVDSTGISYMSSEFIDSKFHQLTGKLSGSQFITFDTFGSTAQKYTRINQVWLHKNHIISQKLLRPSSFTKISPPTIPPSRKDEPYRKKQLDHKGQLDRKKQLDHKWQLDRKEQPLPLSTRSGVPLDGISIIIPAHKASDYIEACLDSMRCLTIPTEIFVGVDNCDSTLIKLTQIQEKYPNLKIFRTNKSVGPYIIRNSLVEHINYSNILFFDADDIMKDSLFTMLSTYNNGSSQIRFKYTNFKNNADPSRSININPKVAHGVFFIPAATFKKVGGFQPWICGADTEFIKRSLANNLHTIEINHCLFYRRIHAESLTNTSRTGYGSDLRKANSAWIKANKNWKIPIIKKTTPLEKIN